LRFLEQLQKEAHFGQFELLTDLGPILELSQVSQRPAGQSATMGALAPVVGWDEVALRSLEHLQKEAHFGQFELLTDLGPVQELSQVKLKVCVVSLKLWGADTTEEAGRGCSSSRCRLGSR